MCGRTQQNIRKKLWVHRWLLVFSEKGLRGSTYREGRTRAKVRTPRGMILGISSLPEPSQRARRLGSSDRRPLPGEYPSCPWSTPQSLVLEMREKIYGITFTVWKYLFIYWLVFGSGTEETPPPKKKELIKIHHWYAEGLYHYEWTN